MDIKKEIAKSKLVNKIDSDETIESVVAFDSEYIKTGIECIFRNIVNKFVGSKSSDLDIDVTYFSPMMYMNDSYEIYPQFLLDEMKCSSQLSFDQGSIEFSVIIGEFENINVMEKIIDYVRENARLSSTQILYSRRPLGIRFDFYYGSSDLDRLLKNFNDIDMSLSKLESIDHKLKQVIAKEINGCS